MSTKNNKVVKPDEDQNASQTVDRSRRSFAKVGAVAPVIMTLTSKTALGSVYQCSISGVHSGNTSSHSSNTSVCGVGISPGGWWQNAHKLKGDPNGGLDDWLCAGVNPFSIKLDLGVKQIQLNKVWTAGYDAVYDEIILHSSFSSTSTSFSSLFGSAPGGGAVSMHDVLYLHQGGGGTLEFHAVAGYLNAAAYANGCKPEFETVYSGITPQDIVGLYILAMTGTPFTSSSGTVVGSSFNTNPSNPSEPLASRVKRYLVMIHH